MTKKNKLQIYIDSDTKEEMYDMNCTHQEMIIYGIKLMTEANSGINATLPKKDRVSHKKFVEFLLSKGYFGE